MEQVLVNINMDADLRKSDVSADHFYSERNMKAIDEAAEQIKQGYVVVKTLEELEAMENE